MRTGQRLPDLRYFHFTDAAELVAQQFFFEMDLLGIVDMLKTTTTATAEMPASRFYPVRISIVQFDDLALGVIAAAVGVDEIQRFAGQGFVDEHHFAVDVADAAAVVG